MPVGDGDLAEQLRRLTEIVIDGQARNESRFDLLQAHIGPLKTDVEKLKNDMTDAKTQILGLTGDDVDLKSDVAVMKLDVKALQSDLDWVRRRAFSIELDLGRVRGDVDEIKAEAEWQSTAGHRS